MRTIILKTAQTFLGLLALLACAATAHAAPYPARAVTLVVPFGPGGASDLAGRAFAQVATTYTGQPFMVVNKDGAGGVIGSQWVRVQKPDGYNLLVARVGAQAMAPALNPKNPFRWDQFTMLGLLQLDPVVFLVKADAPYGSMEELLKTIREKPNTISYSTSGPFTILSIAPQLLLREAGLDVAAAKMVPYKSGGAAMAALLGGHVDFLACNLGEAKNQIESGLLRGVGITSTEGFPSLVNIPLLRDLGFGVLEQLSGWTALYGPEKMPQDMVDYWKDIIGKVGNDPVWREMVHTQGCIPRGLGSDATREFARAQYEMYHGFNLSLRRSNP